LSANLEIAWDHERNVGNSKEFEKGGTVTCQCHGVDWLLLVCHWVVSSPFRATGSLLTLYRLIFAIIGVQSFKSSFRRNCVWVDPLGIQANFTQEFQFCGGHLNAVTGKAEPFINVDGTPGAKHAKGYICPVNSFCIVGDNPYGNTVSFDNILHSLELVFVIMTSNTFTSLMYYTADSDYLAACLCKNAFSAFYLGAMTNE